MTRAEDIVGEKWDRCITDTGIKTVSGLGLGIVASLLLFKRKSWPVVFGAGAGFGKYSSAVFKLPSESSFTVR